jgi:uncharacterized membrane protein YkoI
MDSNLRLLLTWLAIGIFAAVSTAFGDSKPRHRDPQREVEVQQDEALELLTRKEFKPLSEVLAVAEKTIPGQVVRVKVKRLNGALAYELKIISNHGSVREIYIDPMTLAILKVE